MKKDFYLSFSRSLQRSPCGIFGTENSNRRIFPSDPELFQYYYSNTVAYSFNITWRIENGTIHDRSSKRNILTPGERNPGKLENSFQGCTTGRHFSTDIIVFLTGVWPEKIYSSMFTLLMILFQLQVLICFESKWQNLEWWPARIREKQLFLVFCP